MIYIVACWTGFRRTELSSLTHRSFRLDADPPTVHAKTAYSKRRRNDHNPLQPVVTERLSRFLAAKHHLGVGESVFSLRTATGRLCNTAKMMRVDLARVGIPYRDEDAITQTSTRIVTRSSRISASLMLPRRWPKRWPVIRTSI